MSKPTLKPAQLLLVTAIGLICLVVLSLAMQFTQARIARNERAWLEAQINVLVPAELHDNDLLSDRTLVLAPDELGTRNPLAIYRARLRGLPTAAIINSTAADGYNGPIELLVAVDYEGNLLGVRVLSHHETPNMGDAFAQPGDTWLDKFKGRSLTNLGARGWNVAKDGGEFEQFTSATITPRAIIHAVQRTLDYYQRNRTQLFQAASES
ncbi:MAG: electron transport complex subunit RsxG [Steroidobacteraceae bacterium]